MKHGPKEKQTVVCLSLAHTRTPSSLPQLTLPSDSAVDFGNAEKKTRLISSVCASFDNLLQLMCDIDDAVICCNTFDRNTKWTGKERGFVKQDPCKLPLHDWALVYDYSRD